MRFYASWVMQSRLNLILAVVLLSFVPMLGWVVKSTLVLVTLRRGWGEGAIILLSSLVPLLIASFFGHALNDIDIFILLVTYLAAGYLGIQGSLGLTLIFVTVLVGFGFSFLSTQSWSSVPKLSSHLFDFQIKMQESITEKTGALDIVELNEEQVRANADQVFIMVLLMYSFTSLFFGRWWQALLYNSGGFQKEFHDLFLPKITVILLGLVPLLLLAGGKEIELAGWVIAMQFPLLLLGVSVVHFWVKTKKQVVAWLVLFYITLPWTYSLVLLMGIGEGFFGIKQRIGRNNPEEL